MGDPHFTRWKQAAESAISVAGLEKELRFSSVGSRKNDAHYMELVFRGTDPAFGSIVVTIDGGGIHMPTVTDAEDIASALRDEWDKIR